MKIVLFLERDLTLVVAMVMLWSRLEWSQDQWSSLTLLSRGHLLPLCFGFPYYGPTFPLNSQHVCSKWSSAPANQGKMSFNDSNTCKYSFHEIYLLSGEDGNIVFSYFVSIVC